MKLNGIWNPNSNKKNVHALVEHAGLSPFGVTRRHMSVYIFHIHIAWHTCGTKFDFDKNIRIFVTTRGCEQR